MDGKLSIQEPYSCSSIHAYTSSSGGRKTGYKKLEVGNEKTIKAYHVLCSDLINCRPFRRASIGSAENRKGMHGRMAEK